MCVYIKHKIREENIAYLFLAMFLTFAERLTRKDVTVCLHWGGVEEAIFICVFWGMKRTTVSTVGINSKTF
jgi:hypothetical protein